MTRFFFTILQSILLIDNTEQSHVKQATTAIKGLGKTIKNPLFKTIGNNIKNSVGMLRQNKNIIKNFAYGLAEKSAHKFSFKAPYTTNKAIHLVKAGDKKNTQMRTAAYMGEKYLRPLVKKSANYMKGNELNSLFNMVSNNKPQLPFLFAAGGLNRLTQSNLVPLNQGLPNDACKTDGIPRVLMPLADGFEEIETVTIVDQLRRAGAKVTIASLNEHEATDVTGGQNIMITTDTHFENIKHDTFDLIVCSGGQKNAITLGQNRELIVKLFEQRDENRLFAAICASPTKVFDENNLINDYHATSYPSLPLKKLEKTDERVVVDRNLITSRAAGTSTEFALALVEKLFNRERALELADEILHKMN